MDASGSCGSGLDVEYEHDLRARISIINAVLLGDADGTVAQMEICFSAVLRCAL